MAKKYAKKKDFIDSHRQVVERVRKADIARLPVDDVGGSAIAAKVACRTDLVTHNSEVVVPFDEVIFDSGGFVTGNTFVAPLDGLYAAWCGPVPFGPYGDQGWPANSGRMSVYLVLNGEEYVGDETFQVGATDFSNAGYVSRPLRFNAVANVYMRAGDTLEARVYSQFGVDVHCAGGGTTQDDGPGFFVSVACLSPLSTLPPDPVTPPPPDPWIDGTPLSVWRAGIGSQEAGVNYAWVYEDWTRLAVSENFPLGPSGRPTFGYGLITNPDTGKITPQTAGNYNIEVSLYTNEGFPNGAGDTCQWRLTGAFSGSASDSVGSDLHMNDGTAFEVWPTHARVSGHFNGTTDFVQLEAVSVVPDPRNSMNVQGLVKVMLMSTP